MRTLLRPLNEFPSFWYLNEVGVEIEHFISTTLSDKWSQKVLKNHNTNTLQFSIM